MRQPIPGVAPPELGEVTVMTVWPTIAAHPVGQMIGRLCMVRVGIGSFFTLGKLFALMSIPVAMGLFVASLAPPIPFTWPYNRRYRLTNRRVIEAADRMVWRIGLCPIRFELGVEMKAVTFDQFDSIDVQVLPGQEWYPAGELIFRKGAIEVLRLSGVSRPETFRQTCLKALRSHRGVRKLVAN